MPHKSSVSNDTRKLLEELLIHLFRKEELIRWLTVTYDRSLVARISYDGSLAAVAHDAVRVLGSHNLINATFFASLRGARPQSSAIDEIETYMEFGDRSVTIEASTAMVDGMILRLSEIEVQRATVYQAVELSAYFLYGVIALSVSAVHRLDILEVLLMGVVALTLLGVACILAHRRHKIHKRLAEYFQALPEDPAARTIVEQKVAILFRYDRFRIVEYLALLGIPLIACFTVKDIFADCCSPLKAFTRVTTASTLLFLALVVCQMSRKPLLDYLDMAADRQIAAKKSRYLRNLGKVVGALALVSAPTYEVVTQPPGMFQSPVPIQAFEMSRPESETVGEARFPRETGRPKTETPQRPMDEPALSPQHAPAGKSLMMEPLPLARKNSRTRAVAYASSEKPKAKRRAPMGAPGSLTLYKKSWLEMDPVRKRYFVREKDSGQPRECAPIRETHSKPKSSAEKRFQMYLRRRFKTCSVSAQTICYRVRRRELALSYSGYVTQEQRECVATDLPARGSFSGQVRT